jgi:uncharacterized protein (TIGR03435 family)
MKTAVAAVAIWSAVAIGQIASFSQAPAPAPQTPPGELSSTPSKPIEWDVAVFRKNDSGEPRPTLSMPVGGDFLVMKNRPMRDLIRYAYAMTSGAALHFQNEPSWINMDRWDIEAKVAPDDIAEWQRLDDVGHKIALRGLLAEYLHLTVHYDTQLYPCYALIVGTAAPKLIEHKAPPVVIDADGRSQSLTWTTPNQVTASGASMTVLAQMLSGHADRTVIDKTGLVGRFDFVLIFNTQDANPGPGPAPPLAALPPEVATPIEFDAIRQLGLKLVPDKAPIEGIVIDHVELPAKD